MKTASVSVLPRVQLPLYCISSHGTLPLSEELQLKHYKADDMQFTTLTVSTPLPFQNIRINIITSKWISVKLHSDCQWAIITLSCRGLCGVKKKIQLELYSTLQKESQNQVELCEVVSLLWLYQGDMFKTLENVLPLWIEQNLWNWKNRGRDAVEMFLPPLPQKMRRYN